MLTTYRSRGTFARLSAKRGCILIVKLLQFTIVRSLWASLGEATIWKACHKDAITRTKTHNCVGTEKFQGDAVGRSKLTEQTSFYSFNPINPGLFGLEPTLGGGAFFTLRCDSFVFEVMRPKFGTEILRDLLQQEKSGSYR